MMARTKTRSLTVQPYFDSFDVEFRPADRMGSSIRLRGQWLKKLGFLPGEQVEIIESPECLLIKTINHKPIHLHDIPGYEHVKRAIEVALVQEHFMTLIGHKEATEPFLKWGIQHKLPIRTFMPCACGNYMSINGNCSCLPSEVRKHQLAIEKGDLTLTVTPERYQPSYSAPEKEDALLKRVSEAKKMVNAISVNLDKECEYLFKMADQRFNLFHTRRETIINVARSIAALDYSNMIKVHHLSEAIQYSIEPTFN
jgi:hypothetical protein